MRKWLKRGYIAVGAAAIVLVVVAFALYKSVYPGWQVSTNKDDWIVFGTYIGGVLGPGFSGLAFVALLLTLKGSQDALNTSIAQQRIVELERVLTEIKNEIDRFTPEYNAAYSKAIGRTRGSLSNLQFVTDPKLLGMMNLINNAAFFARELLAWAPQSAFVTYFNQAHAPKVKQLYELHMLSADDARVFIVLPALPR